MRTGFCILLLVTTVGPVLADDNTTTWTLPKGWQAGGHIAPGYSFNPHGDTVNSFRVFDDTAQQLTLHQAEIWLEKRATPDHPIGFGLDLVFGQDARKIHAAGLGDPEDVLDITQVYVSAHIPIGPGFEIRFGKFVTMHGAELIRRPDNFNLTRSILFGYAIPFTHTGVLVTTTPAAWLTISAGVVNGWDNVTDNNSAKSVQGMMALSPWNGLTLTVSGIHGAEQDGRNDAKRSLIDVILTVEFRPWTFMVNADYGVETAAVIDPVTGLERTARWYGTAAYVIHIWNTRWAVGVRGEYFVDAQGVRFGYVDPATGGPARGTLWEWTLTVRYTMLEHPMLTGEYRYDSANRPVFGDTTSRTTQHTVALECVCRF